MASSGALGPLYEIVEAGKMLPDGDQVMCIKVVESGEQVGYKLTDILDDPRERSYLRLLLTC